MRSRTRICLTAGAAALAVFVVTAAPSSALPPPGDDGESPIERPPPTRPPTTTTTTEPPAPRVLESLTVTTDSVVATATVHHNGTPALVTIDWGDGTVVSRNPADATDSPFPDPWTPSDPAGTSVFEHAYVAPADGARFTATVTARIGAESQASEVFVTPRYRVAQGTVSLSVIDACDSSFDTRTEWQVYRDGNAAAHRTWEFEESNNGFPPHAIPDSAFHVDVTAEEGRARSVGYFVTETDPFPLIDEFVGAPTLSLDPRLGSRSLQLVMDEYSSDCRGEIITDVDVRLLTPGLSGGPVAGQ